MNIQGRPADTLDRVLGDVFTFFNRRLFQNALPPATISLRASGSCLGLYLKDGPEIALNHAALLDCTDAEVLGTIVHEQAHHWREIFGSADQDCLHDHEWAAKLESVGLM